MDHVEKLRALPLLADLSTDELRNLLRFAPWVEYTKGTVLFREGEEGDYLLIVVSGRFQVSVGQGSAAVMLSHVGPGELLGEAALFRRSVVRSAAVTAVESSEALRVDSAGLAALLADGSTAPRAIEGAVLTTLSRRIQSSRDVVAELLLTEKTAAAGGWLARLRGLVGR